VRIFIYVALFVFGISVLCPAKLPPLAVKDISLMLRSGYSISAVEADLTSRHFLGNIDAAT